MPAAVRGNDVTWGTFLLSATTRRRVSGSDALGLQTDERVSQRAEDAQTSTETTATTQQIYFGE